MRVAARWRCLLSSALFLASTLTGCHAQSTDRNGGVKDSTPAQREAPTLDWGRVSVAHGAYRTRDLGGAAVSLPGEPTPSALEVAITPGLRVSFDGVQYKGLVLLCVSHSLRGDTRDLLDERDILVKALKEQFRRKYANLSFQETTEADNSSIEISEANDRIARFIFRSNKGFLVALGVVSLSRNVAWDSVVEQEFFRSLTFAAPYSLLTLTRSTDDLLVFADPSDTTFFIIPRVQFDSELPVLLTFSSETNSVHFMSSLVWSDKIGVPRDALHERYEPRGSTVDLFRHDLANVTVSLTMNGVTVCVWHEPRLKEDFGVTFHVGQPQYDALAKLALSPTVRETATLRVDADLVRYGTHITFEEKAFPREVVLKVDRL